MKGGGGEERGGERGGGDLGDFDKVEPLKSCLHFILHPSILYGV